MKLFESETALAQIKRILGDELVVGAWIVEYSEGGPEEEFVDDGTDDLELHYKDLMFELNNGNKVILWSSEWGGISRVIFQQR